MSKLYDCALLKLTFPFLSSCCFGDCFPLYHRLLLPTWGFLKIKEGIKQLDKVSLRLSDFKVCKVILFLNARLTSVNSKTAYFNKNCSTET